jgi:hypothetical protein
VRDRRSFESAVARLRDTCLGTSSSVTAVSYVRLSVGRSPAASPHASARRAMPLGSIGRSRVAHETDDGFRLRRYGRWSVSSSTTTPFGFTAPSGTSRHLTCWPGVRPNRGGARCQTRRGARGSSPAAFRRSCVSRGAASSRSREGGWQTVRMDRRIQSIAALRRTSTTYCSGSSSPLQRSRAAQYGHSGQTSPSG